MLGERVGGGEQPMEIEMFAEEGAFRIPERSELSIGSGGSEFPADQYDQPGMVPEQFGLTGKFKAQVLDMPIKLFAAAPGQQRRAFVDDACLHGGKVRNVCDLLAGAEAFATLVERQEAFNPGFPPRAHLVPDRAGVRIVLQFASNVKS